MRARHISRGGTCREGSHPGGWGPSRRPPLAGCAGPHRENWPEVGVPVPARYFRLLRSTPRGEPVPEIGVRPDARLWRAVPAPTGRTGQRSGVPVPARYFRLLRSTPRGEPSRRLESVPTPAFGGLCRPEVGVPNRPRAFSRLATRGFAALVGLGGHRGRVRFLWWQIVARSGKNTEPFALILRLNPDSGLGVGGQATADPTKPLQISCFPTATTLPPWM